MAKKDMKIAVIGGGFSGLGTVGILKEDGFDPICFEKTNQIGGTWCYREESIPGVGSTMPTTIINHSKEMGAFSNLPPKKEYSNYMRHSELYKYMLTSVEERDVMRHVRLNSEVVSCKRTEDYEDTGRWVVTVKDTVTGIETSDVYDAVVMGVGHINRPKIPHFPGLDRFTGKVIHTHNLKGVADFKGQNVVVIGMGCSGLDAAAEISSVAKQVYLSTKSGSHVFSRVGPHGYPIDYTLMRRYILSCLDIFPTWLCGWLIRKIYFDPMFDYKLYAVEPSVNLFAKDPVFNDQIFSKLLSGAVIQKRDVARFTDKGVVFESEDEVTNVDVVIMATGYDWKFPFLEEGVVVQDKDGVINLFKCIWPPHLKHPTFAVVGFVLPFGPGFPIGELQCRYVADVISGRSKLPSQDVMMKDIKKRHDLNVARYLPNDKMSVRVDFLQYCDEIASEIGAKPNLWKLFFTDLQLFWKLMFGPSVSYQYRLEGPHKWEGARDAIMTVGERLHFPLVKEKKRKRLSLIQIAEKWLHWFGAVLGFQREITMKKNN